MWQLLQLETVDQKGFQRFCYVERNEEERMVLKINVPRADESMRGRPRKGHRDCQRNAGVQRAKHPEV